jgi:hypothetical protein
LILFLCGFWRHNNFRSLTAEEREAVDLADEHAEGWPLPVTPTPWWRCDHLGFDGDSAWGNATSVLVAYESHWRHGWGLSGWEAEWDALRAPACQVLRCVAGNPFRPVSLDAALRIPTVLALAQAAYDNRILPSGRLEPDRLAVLGDALEESGCGEVEILGHLRRDSPHWRGCWAVDAILYR